MKDIFKRQLIENIAHIKASNGMPQILLFGHCEATMDAVLEFRKMGIEPLAILDNNPGKIGQVVSGVEIIEPAKAIEIDNSITCVAARAYTAMVEQLRDLGYKGEIIKLIDYDPYSAPSVDTDVIDEKLERLNRGIDRWNILKKKYPNDFVLVCPYGSLGDVVHALEYFPYFAAKHSIENIVVAVIGDSNLRIAAMYGYDRVMTFSWQEMTELVQAILYLAPSDAFITHNDKPYTVYLPNILHQKFISHEKMYCCGVYGLDIKTKPVAPTRLKSYPFIDNIKKGKTVILSPYADSITRLDDKVWYAIVDVYKSKGYDLYTNVIGDEKPLVGTKPISPHVDEMQPLVETAGSFIGLRSGMCDVIRFADCRKVALYPRQFYSDTRWTLHEMFSIDTFENIVVDEDFKWTVN